MVKEKRYYIGLLVAIAICLSSFAQNDSINLPLPDSVPVIKKEAPTNKDAHFIIRTITVEGNRRTKTEIILRELPFKIGDGYTLQELVKKFETGRRQLMNTALFHEVVVALYNLRGYDVDVKIQVKERLYLFPVPYFKPVDRNLNQWLVEQKASLKRVNYGAKLLYNNVTGRNDKLRFWLISGYTRQLSFSYDRLYIDKKLKWGINMGLSLGNNKEINYNTVDDKQVFFKDNNNFVRKFFSSYAELTYRRAIRTRHRFGIAYSKESVADTVIKLNPDYFAGGRKKVEYPELYYIMTYYNLDYIPYPTKGYAAEINVSKKGINKAFNLWQFSAKGSGNWNTGKKSFVSLNALTAIKLPFSQPYFNQKLLGYSDAFLQGYEYYVIDGTAAAYLKATYTRKLVEFSFHLPGTKKIAPKNVPVKIYGKVFGNTGYIYNPKPGNNSLSNQTLVSSGFGLDVVTIYDFILKLEWSFNQLGQNGLFLHRKTIF